MEQKIQQSIDPVTASVIQGALQNIAIEMGYKLMRMSYSSIIRESEDFGTALTDAKGNQLAESVQSTPLQSGPIPGYVKNVVGGEIDEYTKLQAQAREQAISRMKDDANSLGADAVINVRITTSMIMQGCSEIMAYGTAVKLS